MNISDPIQEFLFIIFPLLCLLFHQFLNVKFNHIRCFQVFFNKFWVLIIIHINDGVEPNHKANPEDKYKDEYGDYHSFAISERLWSSFFCLLFAIIGYGRRRFANCKVFELLFVGLSIFIAFWYFSSFHINFIYFFRY